MFGAKSSSLFMPSIRRHLPLLFSTLATLTGCVSAGKYKALQEHAQNSDSLYTQSIRTLKICQDANSEMTRQKADMQAQMTNLNGLVTAAQENNSLLRKQLQSLSALSSTQAESIKRSLDNIGAKDSYIQELRAAIGHRDSVNLAVVLNLKAAVGGYGEDVGIKVEKGVVYVDLSEKLLFNSDSNSYKVDDKAKPVLGRLARVLNDQPDIEFTVVGHTESVAHPDSVLVDNWDLSAKRATSVVRILQTDFNVSPLRMMAAGRSEYAGMAPVDTPEGRAANRRTRVVIHPQLDPLLRLLERKEGSGTAE
jgi:chemotaxis protein MotB